MQDSIKWKCIDCDESHNLPIPKPNTQHVCVVCGSKLIRVDETDVAPSPISLRPQPSPIGPTLNGINASWEGLFDIVGDEFRDAIQESMSMAAPTRQISSKYLSTLGKVTIDSRFSILYDISIVIGPLTVLGVSASFGHLPEQKLFDGVFQLVEGGCTLEETSVTPGSIVALSRGMTSFESKGKEAVAAGACALLVYQTYDKWPFVMTSDENSCEVSAIPIVMVSKLHGEVISKLAVSSSKKGGKAVSMRLKIGEKSCECSVCQENFAVGEKVYKLPCRHVYHCECVATWLQNNHTCPLCRLQLPRELPSASSATTQRSDINHIYY